MRRIQWIIPLISGIMVMAGCSHCPNGKGCNDTVTVGSLARQPDVSAGKSVQVQGTLVNAGSNYFTDMRLRLVGQPGDTIAVNGWLPMEVPPPPPGGAKVKRPEVLSDYLGKRVDIRGIWQKQDNGYQLKVEKATIIQTKEVNK